MGFNSGFKGLSVRRILHLPSALERTGLKATVVYGRRIMHSGI
jgi:hypothetical protein